MPFRPLSHTSLFTRSFQLEPLTSIPFHRFPHTLFSVRLFPLLDWFSRIPSWWLYLAMFWYSVLLDEFFSTIPSCMLLFAVLLIRVFQFEFVRLIPLNVLEPA